MFVVVFFFVCFVVVVVFLFFLLMGNWNLTKPLLYSICAVHLFLIDISCLFYCSFVLKLVKCHLQLHHTGKAAILNCCESRLPRIESC